MPTPVIMPKVDMDQVASTIISWEKAEGDHVKFDETLLTVETDKVAIEVNSPGDGILSGILFHEGEVVPVATVIAYILKPGESLSDVEGTSAPKLDIATKPVQEPVSTVEEKGKQASPIALKVAKELNVDIRDVPSSNRVISREDVEAYAATLVEKTAPGFVPGSKIAATPAARRVSKEKNIALESLKGSGPFGRIQLKDVAHVAHSSTEPETALQAEIVPMTGKRAHIARKMQSSFQTVPHIFETIEADMTRLEELRARINENSISNGTGKVSLTAILVRLVAWALEHNKYLNASLLDDGIHLWKEINIGVATTLDDGLIVPVIHNANHLSYSETALRLNELSQKARKGKIELSEVQRGTFTISNLGMYGITQFNAIINPPEVAILAVGASVRKPVVIDQHDNISVRPIVKFTLSADHRVIDGVVAAKFLADLVKVIEHPEILYE